MPGEKDTERGLVVGGMGGVLIGALIATLLAAKPAEAAPPDEKLDYLIECQTAIVQLLGQLAEGNTTMIGLLQQLVTAAGMPGVPGVEVIVKTPWVAKTPEQIYSQDIRVAGTFYSDVMVDWTKGKRLIIMVQSSLNQACQIQLIGNFVDNMPLASDINAPIDVGANENHSVGPAWDDWHPFIGVRITTTLPAPTAGILNIWAVLQE